MTISVWSIGKTKDKYLQAGIEQYLSKLKHYTKLDYQEYKVKGLSDPKAQISRDQELILQQLQPSDVLILLDEKGKRYASRAFAKMIESHRLHSTRRLVFVIGGAFGHGDALRNRANASLSMSDFTFTHDMSRLILLEQLYRAMTILRGEPYHND